MTRDDMDKSSCIGSRVYKETDEDEAFIDIDQKKYPDKWKDLEINEYCNLCTATAKHYILDSIR